MRRHLNFDSAQGALQLVLEVSVDALEQFALLVMNQRRAVAIRNRNRHGILLDMTAPAFRRTVIGQLRAQGAADFQLQTQRRD